MDIDKLTIGEARELAAMFSQVGTCKKSPHIDKHVIIRSYGSGVHAGTLVSKSDTLAGVEVELKDSKRIHYWKGAASLSQLAMEGVSAPNECRIPCPVETMTVTQVLEIIPTTERARKSLNEVPVWEK